MSTISLPSYPTTQSSSSDSTVPGQQPECVSDIDPRDNQNSINNEAATAESNSTTIDV